MSSDRLDWNTPERVLDLVRQVGQIGLDPCSNATSLVRASVEWVFGGLDRSWRNYGLVYVNPPYGREIEPWIVRCASGDGDEVVALLPARTDTRWWRCVATAQAVCFWHGRLRFLGAPSSAPFPSAIAYWGPRAGQFSRVFGPHGWIVSTRKEAGYKEEIEVEVADENARNKNENESQQKKDHEQGEIEMAFLPPEMAKETAEAEASFGRERLKDGDYVFLHKACTYEKTRGGPAVIIEHKIVEAKAIKAGVDPSPVGTSWGYFLPDYGEAAVMLKPNLKAYCCGMLGIDPKKAPKDELAKTIEALGDARQAGRGMLIRGTTFHTEKKDGEDFMGVNWSAYQGENVLGSPSVLKRRAELDNEAPAASASAPAGAPSAPPLSAPALPASAPPLDPVAAAMAAGWQVHPKNPEFFWRGSELKPKADILAGRL